MPERSCRIAHHEMPYSYDRRRVVASRTSQILHLIVDKAMHERNVHSLVNAYVDELEEEWEEAHEDDDQRPETVADHDKWLTKTFGILHTSDDVEQAMANAFAATYRRLVKHPVSLEETLDVFIFPIPGFPTTGVPKAVAVEVAQAMARRDAAEAQPYAGLGTEKPSKVLILKFLAQVGTRQPKDAAKACGEWPGRRHRLESEKSRGGRFGSRTDPGSRPWNRA